MTSRPKQVSASNGFHFTISQVAKMLDVSASTLRQWERRGLASPQRTDGGYRVYLPKDVERLKHVRQLRVVQHLNPEAIVHLMGSSEPASEGRPGSRSRPVSIAARLRKLRQGQGLTLAEAANRAGLSPSFLSCLERGQANASVASLQRLSLLYNTSVLAFFDKPKQERKLVRAHRRKSLSNEPGITIELLAQGQIQMEPHMFHIAPGASSGGSYHHEGEEFVFVLSGSCEFWLDEVEHFRLETGDSLYFSSRQTHRWSNVGQVEAVLLWINTPPTF